MNPGWIEAVATLVASGVAAWGIGSWRGQKRGNTEHDAAFRALTASINAGAAFQKTGVALQLAGEQLGITSSIQGLRATISALDDSIADLEAAKTVVEATWDDATAEILDELEWYLRYWSMWCDQQAAHFGDGPEPTSDNGTHLDARILAALEGDREAQSRHEAHVRRLIERVKNWSAKYLHRGEAESLWAKIFAAAEPPPPRAPGSLTHLEGDEYIAALMERLDGETPALVPRSGKKERP